MHESIEECNVDWLQHSNHVAILVPVNGVWRVIVVNLDRTTPCHDYNEAVHIARQKLADAE